MVFAAGIEGALFEGARRMSILRHPVWTGEENAEWESRTV